LEEKQLEIKVVTNVKNILVDGKEELEENLVLLKMKTPLQITQVL
jgi:hypothetical protein